MAVAKNKEGGTLKSAKNTYGKKVVKAAKAYNKGLSRSGPKVENKMRNRIDKNPNSKVANAYWAGYEAAVKKANPNSVNPKTGLYKSGTFGEGMRFGSAGKKVKSMARIQKTLGGKKK